MDSSEILNINLLGTFENSCYITHTNTVFVKVNNFITKYTDFPTVI